MSKSKNKTIYLKKEGLLLILNIIIANLQPETLTTSNTLQCAHRSTMAWSVMLQKLNARENISIYIYTYKLHMHTHARTHALQRAHTHTHTHTHTHKRAHTHTYYPTNTSHANKKCFSTQQVRLPISVRLRRVVNSRIDALVTLRQPFRIRPNLRRMKIKNS